MHSHTLSRTILNTKEMACSAYIIIESICHAAPNLAGISSRSLECHRWRQSDPELEIVGQDFIQVQIYALLVESSYVKTFKNLSDFSRISSEGGTVQSSSKRTEGPHPQPGTQSESLATPLGDVSKTPRASIPPTSTVSGAPLGPAIRQTETATATQVPGSGSDSGSRLVFQRDPGGIRLCGSVYTQHCTHHILFRSVCPDIPICTASACISLSSSSQPNWPVECIDMTSILSRSETRTARSRNSGCLHRI